MILYFATAGWSQQPVAVQPSAVRSCCGGHLSLAVMLGDPAQHFASPGSAAALLAAAAVQLLPDCPFQLLHTTMTHVTSQTDYAFSWMSWWL